MKKYYVSTRAQNNGDHEVHTEFCTYLPNPENKKYLGEFYSCDQAVTEAKKTFYQSNGCFYCAKSCHTS